MYRKTQDPINLAMLLLAENITEGLDHVVKAQSFHEVRHPLLREVKNTRLKVYDFYQIFFRRFPGDRNFLERIVVHPRYVNHLAGADLFYITLSPVDLVDPEGNPVPPPPPPELRSPLEDWSIQSVTKDGIAPIHLPEPPAAAPEGEPEGPPMSERIPAALLRAMDCAPFLARILLRMEIAPAKPDAGLDTIAINEGYQVWYHGPWLASLKPDAFCGVLLHEACHIALDSFGRRDQRDPRLWNVASDLVINHMLAQMHVTLPTPGLIPHADGQFVFPDGEIIRVSGKTAEEVYQSLAKSMNGERVEALAFDRHLHGLGVLGGAPGGDGSSDTGGDGKHHGEIFGPDPEHDLASIQERWRGIVGESWARAVGAPGPGEHQLLLLIETLRRPKLDWRTLMRRFFKDRLISDLTFLRPANRSWALGTLFPSAIRRSLSITVAIDVSPSIEASDYEAFMTEVASLLRMHPQMSARVIWFSDKIFPKDDRTFTGHGVTGLLAHRPRRGRGTHLGCVAEHLRHKGKTPDAVLVLTDGYVEDKPALIPKAEHLFVICPPGGGKHLADYGKVIELTKD